jgi:beta-glucosidase
MAALLPLAANKHVLVTGDGADNISKQSGGWTITWQGTGLTNADFPGGTSVWGGVKAAVKAGGGSAELSTDGSYKKKPDVAVVVFGENPYAEFQGDLKVMTLPGTMTQHLEIMKKFHDEKIPVVAILLSGRPLWQNRELNLANAYLAAWLPGTEGGGITDVLFRKKDGAVNFDFTGKLAYSWPRDATGTPLNVNKEPYDPLFPFGFGLTYAAPVELAALPEDPGVPAELMSTGSYFDKGTPVQPWSLRVSNGTDSTRISAVPAESVGGRVKVTAIDDQVQEGARRFVFAGDGKGTVQLTSEGTVDISRETNGDVMLLVRLKRGKRRSGRSQDRCCLRRGLRRPGALRRDAERGAGEQVADGRRVAQVLHQGRRGRDQGQRGTGARDRRQARPRLLAGQARHRGRQDPLMQLMGTFLIC